MRKTGLACLMICLLTGCAQLQRLAPLADLPKRIIEPVMPKAADTVGSASPAPVTDIDTGTAFSDTFVIRDMDASDPLPDFTVKPVSLGNATVYEALRTVLAHSGIPFLINDHLQPPQNNNLAGNNGGTTAATSATAVNNSTLANNQTSRIIDRRINAINLSGPLQKVLDILADSGDFFYRYKNGVLRVTPDRYFMVSLPPNDESESGVSDTIQALGANYVYQNQQARSLVFIASRDTYEKVKDYLRNLRATRSLIVYDTYIYQVQLSDATATGIQWNQFNVLAGKWALNATQTPPLATDGMAISTVYNSSHFNLNQLVSFLRSQGTVRTVSQPKLTLLSGTKSSIDVGDTTNYVSSIGASTTNNTTQTTVQTASILSGLKMAVTGDIDDGTVYTKVDISLSDLLGMQNFTAMGTTLELPQTSTRDISTQIRCRPGDTIMLAGMDQTQDDKEAAGMPGLNNTLIAPTHANTTQGRTELVIVLRPRVIRFTDGKGGKS